jgi:molybdate transport system regulatory protein
MPDDLNVRFRVDFGDQCSIGVGKIQLLEAIARTGSLSKAARAMNMSYRRAWLLLADLNASFNHPVVQTKTGGTGGGGAVLTPLGGRLIEGYRKLESGLQPLAKRWLEELGRSVVDRSKRLVERAPLKRRRLAAGSADGR